MNSISHQIVYVNIDQRLEYFIRNFCTLSDEKLPQSFVQKIRKILLRDLNKSESLMSLSSTPFTELPAWLFENKSSTKYRSVHTINGYPIDVAKSAMQKYTRRGFPEECMYAMVEMNFFKWLEGGKASFTNFKNRMKVILLEDVGIASPVAIPMANKLIKAIETSKTPFPNELVSLAWLMSNSLHYRMYSMQRAYYHNNKPEPKKPQVFFPTPEARYKTAVESLVYCLENKDPSAYWWMSILAGSEDLLHGKKYYNRSKVPYLGFAVLEWFFKQQGNIHPLIWENFHICLDWYKNLNIKENMICLFHPMYLYILEDKLDFGASTYQKNGSIINYYPNLLNERLTFIDPVYDMHTGVGRRMGKDSVNFASEGSLVGFEDMSIDFPASRRIYVSNKVKDGNVRSEKSLFTLKVRAQLTCSQSRPDVYFAKMRGKNVVVKGPYYNYEQANKSFQVSRLLSLFEEVNTIGTDIVLAKPDMFESVPVGCRRDMVKNRAYYFLVFDDIYDLDEYPIKNKSSKLWKNEPVVDFDKLFRDIKGGFATPSAMSEKTCVSLLYQLAIRYTFELGDFAARNFTWFEDKVWNLDTEGMFVGKSLRWKKSEREILIKTLNKNKEEITNVLQNWLKPDGKNVSLYDRWYMVKRVMKLSSQQIKQAKENLQMLIDGYEQWLNE